MTTLGDLVGHSGEDKEAKASGGSRGAMEAEANALTNGMGNMGLGVGCGDSQRRAEAEAKV